MVYALGSNFYILQKMMGICQSKIGASTWRKRGGEGLRGRGNGVSWRGGGTCNLNPAKTDRPVVASGAI